MMAPIKILSHLTVSFIDKSVKVIEINTWLKGINGRVRKDHQDQRQSADDQGLGPLYPCSPNDCINVREG